MTRRYFISGTDTAVGKTLISVALVKAAQAAGYRAMGLKPVSAGCELREGIWQNEDAIALRNASNTLLTYEQVNPVALHEFMAPHLAAAQAGIAINAVDLCEHIAKLPAADIAFIEGAGGWLVPLNSSETMADIAVGLNTPVILVVGMRLGCINHSLLSAAAIRQAGLELAGWVANGVDPHMAALSDNIQAIADRIDAPLLGSVPYMSNPDTGHAASQLTIEPLLN